MSELIERLNTLADLHSNNPAWHSTLTEAAVLVDRVQLIGKIHAKAERGAVLFSTTTYEANALWINPEHIVEIKSAVCCKDLLIVDVETFERFMKL